MSILAKLHMFNVIIYQIESEDMLQEFHSWDTPGLKTIHLTYHRGRHYNSVRRDSNDDGPAVEQRIRHPLMQISEADIAEEEEKERKRKHDSQKKSQNTSYSFGSFNYRSKRDKVKPGASKDMDLYDLAHYAQDLIGVSDYYNMREAIDECFPSQARSYFSKINSDQVDDNIDLIVDCYYRIVAEEIEKEQERNKRYASMFGVGSKKDDYRFSKPYRPIGTTSYTSSSYNPTSYSYMRGPTW